MDMRHFINTLFLSVLIFASCTGAKDPQKIDTPETPGKEETASGKVQNGASKATLNSCVKSMQ